MRRAAMLALALSLAACSDSPAPRPRARAPEAAEARTPVSRYTEVARSAIAPPLGDPAGDVAPTAAKALSFPGRERLAPLIDTIAVSERIDPALVHAIIAQESQYRERAISPKGAVGLMQLMPDTGQRFGVSPGQRFDPAQNIRGGIRYLKWLLGYFNGKLDLAIAAYNAGEGAVLRYGRQIPPYGETQNYVRRVKGYYAGYRLRARQAQTRSQLAEADARRWRALSAGDSRERDPSRERATGQER